MAWNVYTYSIVPDPIYTAVTMIEVKLLSLTVFNVRDFCVDVVWVRSRSFDEEGTRIHEAAVSPSSLRNTSSIVPAMRMGNNPILT